MYVQRNLYNPSTLGPGEVGLIREVAGMYMQVLSNIHLSVVITMGCSMGHFCDKTVPLYKDHCLQRPQSLGPLTGHYRFHCMHIRTYIYE